MQPFTTALLALLAFSTFASGQADEAPAPAPLQAIDVPDDGIRVSVLGYHDFSENERETAMRIRTSKFRKQMEVIKKLDIPVIPMADFIAWKDTGKAIPQKAIVITLDDGWKSVYTDAYPVLKELGFPFTLYLYKDYVDGGGKALTADMIQEMMAHGATIGSHSTTHPFPQTVKRYRKEGPEAYDSFLNREMRDSKKFLEDTFKITAATYAYPGGYFTEEMLTKANQIGYTHLFTVQPGKVKRSLLNHVLPRYIILGNHDRIFDFALNFRDSQTTLPTDTVASMMQELKYPVTPAPSSIINTRLPEISVNLATVPDLDPATLRMQVSGFGEVPANFASEAKTFLWRVNRPLRQPLCHVRVTWKDLSGKDTETPLKWSFQIDRESAYLPGE